MSGNSPYACRVIVVAIFVSVLQLGCSPKYPTSDYGAIDGATARSSPDGFSVMRLLCVERGYSVTSIRSLPVNGERKISTLIWAPHGFNSHSEESMDWVDRWLQSGNKTLVYVHADYSPLEDYWQATEELLDSENEAREAKINAAMEKSSLLTKLVGGFPTIAYPWGVYQKKLGEYKPVQSWLGDWSSDLETLDSNLKLRSSFRAWSEVSDDELEQLLKNQGSGTNTSASAPPSPSPSPSSQPTAASQNIFSWIVNDSWGEQYAVAEQSRRKAKRESARGDVAEAENENELWNIFDEDALEESGGVPQTERDDRLESSRAANEPTIEVPLGSEDNTPFVSVISKPSWNGSRIVVLANASLVSNLSLTYNGNRFLAERLISSFSPGRIGFLSQYADPMVMNGENDTTGLASLLTKPVNLLAAHLVSLGIIALLCLWPIFGRPAELPPQTTQSFSLHINALGNLLQKTGDQFYARTTIADYFRQVKKDHNSVWSDLDSVYAPTNDSPFRQDEVNSSSKNTNG